MSQPPGSADQGPPDPWATPTGPSPAAPAYGQPAYGQPGPPPYGYPARTNGKAQTAMWTGIASLVLTFCCLGGLLGFVPVILGVLARREVLASGGQQTGAGMALAGIVTGAVALAISLLLVAGLVLLLAHGGLDPGDSATTGGTPA